MKILVTLPQVPYVLGGAELHSQELVKHLRLAGHEAEVVTHPFGDHSPDAVLEAMVSARMMRLVESSGRRVDRLIAVKFPSYYAPHPHKVVWLLHQHRTAYDLWSHPLADLPWFEQGLAVRDAIRAADRQLLPDARALFTISRNVSRRLEHFSGLDAEPLYHPPPDAGALGCAPAEDYLFMPSRINALKRQSLVVEALAHTTEPVRVRFSGAADHEDLLAAVQQRAESLGVADRVEWLGRTEAPRLRDLYARCMGVIFPPVDEDYGYITLEAMLSSKPVITCEDSGGPLEFVVPNETGLVSPATAEGLAAAMDHLWSNRERAARMGRNGRERYASLSISWDRVLERLLA